MNWFVSSVSLENYPLKMASTRIRNKFCLTLEEAKMDEDLIDETDVIVRKFNRKRNEMFINKGLKILRDYEL